MKIRLEVYDALCNTRDFEINGVTADSRDFGEQEDTDPDEAEEYACGNMQFIPFTVAPEGVLTKYGITQKEFDTVAEELSEKLSFGPCSWCA